MTKVATDPQAHRSSYERLYASSGLHDERGFYRWALRQFPLQKGARVLDVACGEGGVLMAGAELGRDVWGVDIAFNAVSRIPSAGGPGRVLVASAEQLPFAEGAFDAVTCFGSLENFEQMAPALAEMRRVLTGDGWLCVMMPNKFWLGDIVSVCAGKEEQVPFQHVERVATIGQWRNLLEAQGFNVVRVRGYVKRPPLCRNGKLRSLRKFLASRLMSACCPTALSWSLLYVCRRGPIASRPEAARVWMWRAE
ncbi:MAG TPA: class I SAM-dependent methyltransferase [bacterium]